MHHFQAHLFYINQTNFLQEVISNDNLTTWNPGPLSSEGVQASPNASALAALYNETYFGTSKNSAGLRLYYGNTNNEVQELAFAIGGQSWNMTSTLNGTDGNGGIAAWNTNGQGIAHLYVLDPVNNLFVWSGDFNQKAVPSFSTYGMWEKSTS